MRAIKQLVIKGVVLPTIAICSLLVCAEPSKAADVTFLFTGSVQSVDPTLHASPDNLHLGPMTGSMTFDSDAPDNGFGNHNDAIKAFTWTIPMGGGTYTVSWASTAHTQVSLFDGSSDQFDASSPVTGGTINGQTPTSWSMFLEDQNGTVFSSNNLPTTPPSLSSFNSGTWVLSFLAGNAGGGSVIGSFSTLTAPVPLPPAVILFGAGLAALVGLGARSWRQKSPSLT